MYEPRRILVPTDFSSHAEAALGISVQMASSYHGEITLLHVDEFPVSPLGALEVQGFLVAVLPERSRAIMPMLIFSSRVLVCSFTSARRTLS